MNRAVAPTLFQSSISWLGGCAIVLFHVLCEVIEEGLDTLLSIAEMGRFDVILFIFVGVVLRIKFVNLIVKAVRVQKSRAWQVASYAAHARDHLADVTHSVWVLKPDLDAVESDTRHAAIHLDKAIFQVGVGVLIHVMTLNYNPYAEKNADDEAGDHAKPKHFHELMSNLMVFLNFLYLGSGIDGGGVRG